MQVSTISNKELEEYNKKGESDRHFNDVSKYFFATSEIEKFSLGGKIIFTNNGKIIHSIDINESNTKKAMEFDVTYIHNELYRKGVNIFPIPRFEEEGIKNNIDAPITDQSNILIISDNEL